MINLPIFESLEKSQRILIAGAGGGFDIYAGLPLYLMLKEVGKDVHLANLSFTNLSLVPDERPSPALVPVTADTVHEPIYFPELYLAQWFRAVRDEEVTVYSFEKCGVQPVLEAYKWLQSKFNFDTVVLVDGGTDILMRGDEVGLGTPIEDMTSLSAVSQLEGVETKIVACLGFGVDHFHGVQNSCTFQAISELTEMDGFLGSFSLVNSMESAKQYMDACKFAFTEMPHHISIVNASIMTALRGKYGDVHFTPRTHGSTLWINPLMSVYWYFKLPVVADRCLYLDELKETETLQDVKEAIRRGAYLKTEIRRGPFIPQ